MVVRPDCRLGLRGRIPGSLLCMKKNKLCYYVCVTSTDGVCAARHQCAGVCLPRECVAMQYPRPRRRCYAAQRALPPPTMHVAHHESAESNSSTRPQRIASRQMNRQCTARLGAGLQQLSSTLRTRGCTRPRSTATSTALPSQHPWRWRILKVDVDATPPRACEQIIKNKKNILI